MHCERTGPNVLTLRHPVVEAGWSQRYLLIADIHFDNPLCDRRLLTRHLDEAKRIGAGVMCFGDWFDVMGGRNDPRRSKTGTANQHNVDSYLDAVVDESAEYLSPYQGNLLMMADGNHECYDDQTEVLTDSGWKLFRDLNKSERVATLNLDTSFVEWQTPSSYHVSHYVGKMHHIKARGANFLVTPNHRIVYKSQGGETYQIKRSYEFSYSLGAQITIPVSGRSGREDYPLVSDDELSLLGWMLTDGSIKAYDGNPTPRVQLYQRPAKVKLITDILDRLGYQYAYKERERTTDSIQNKELKQKTSIQCTITLQGDGKARVLELLDSQRAIPEWMHEVSDRQFTVFLASFIDGDGSRHKSAPSSWMAYGERAMLERLQALCVTHGYKASLATYRECQYRLNITNHRDYCLRGVGNLFSEIDYDGQVYCLTVANGTMFVRRNGYVCVSGNTAIRRNVEVDLLEHLCRALQVQHMGYSGWIRMMFERAGARGSRSQRRMWYHHGSGGGGAVTKGVIATNRRAAMISDADIVVSGHVHEAWCLEIVRHGLSDGGNERLSTQLHVSLPTYKQEWDLAGGWHMERGAPPKPLGGWWLDLHFDGTKPGNVNMCVQRAT